MRGDSGCCVELRFRYSQCLLRLVQRGDVGTKSWVGHCGSKLVKDLLPCCAFLELVQAHLAAGVPQSRTNTSLISAQHGRSCAITDRCGVNGQALLEKLVASAQAAPVLVLEVEQRAVHEVTGERVVNLSEADEQRHLVGSPLEVGIGGNGPRVGFHCVQRLTVTIAHERYAGGALERGHVGGMVELAHDRLMHSHPGMVPERFGSGDLCIFHDLVDHERACTDGACGDIRRVIAGTHRRKHAGVAACYRIDKRRVFGLSLCGLGGWGEAFGCLRDSSGHAVIVEHFLRCRNRLLEFRPVVDALCRQNLLEPPGCRGARLDPKRF